MKRLTHSSIQNDSPHDQMVNRAEFGLPVSQPRPDRYSYLTLIPMRTYRSFSSISISISG